MMIIDELANVIKKEFSVQKIILFGSHAYGQPHKDSDVDICVIMETNLPFP
ncbi:MAG TPA: nucleotidyltransferase domain-containing protein, partial [Spirochaetota bacterium]|nr:nucleotidyltransferase domain-containing protein [Spirochaetota bacterium]